MAKKLKAASARLARGGFVLPSPEDVERSKTAWGSWTAFQLAEWGVAWPPRHGWRAELRERWEAEQSGAPTVDSLFLD